MEMWQHIPSKYTIHWTKNNNKYLILFINTEVSSCHEKFQLLIVRFNVNHSITDLNWCEPIISPISNWTYISFSHVSVFSHLKFFGPLVWRGGWVIVLISLWVCQNIMYVWPIGMGVCSWCRGGGVREPVKTLRPANFPSFYHGKMYSVSKIEK